MRRLPWLSLCLLALPTALFADEPDRSPIRLYVMVPADARLTVNGTAVSQTGPERRLITPPLAAGERGKYTLVITFLKDGRTVRVERDVIVTGGQDGRVDLTREEPDDEPKVVAKKEPPKVVPKQEPRKVVPKKEAPPAVKKESPATTEPKLDVPFVPTPQDMVDRMLEVAGVKEGDTVFDLGSGDGRIVITAVKQHKAKRGVGVELAAERVKLAKENAEKARVADRAEFRQGDVLRIKDLSEASVVTLQLLPDVNERLKPVLRKTLKPGARVVSFDFDMGEDWKPDREVTVKDKDGREHTIYLWTIKELTKKGPKKENIPPIPIKELPKPDAKKDPPKAEPRKDKKDDDTIRVVYVPTSHFMVEQMLKMAGVKEGDVVYDLGCGDGRIVVSAVKDFKARRGVGVDIDPDRIKDSKKTAAAAKVEDNVEFREGDVLKIADVSEATVVALYLFPEVNERLAPMLKKTLKPGSRIVSHEFLMGDWKPDKTVELTDTDGERRSIHLWTIPK